MIYISSTLLYHSCQAKNALNSRPCVCATANVLRLEPSFRAVSVSEWVKYPPAPLEAVKESTAEPQSSQRTKHIYPQLIVIDGFMNQILCALCVSAVCFQYLASIRRQALSTRSVEISRMHRGRPYTAQVYPGHGMQGRSERTLSYALPQGCQAV